MSSVWQNATETEVYAASLALALATDRGGGLAGRVGERRLDGCSWSYLIALAVPLHMSALVARAGRGATLAGRRRRGSIDVGRLARRRSCLAGVGECRGRRGPRCRSLVVGGCS